MIIVCVWFRSNYIAMAWPASRIVIYSLHLKSNLFFLLLIFYWMTNDVIQFLDRLQFHKTMNGWPEFSRSWKAEWEQTEIILLSHAPHNHWSISGGDNIHVTRNQFKLFGRDPFILLTRRMIRLCARELLKLHFNVKYSSGVWQVMVQISRFKVNLCVSSEKQTTQYVDLTLADGWTS